MDFDNLKQKIEYATKKAFAQIFEEHATEGVYSFALYSDQGAMTVSPSTNTLKALSEVDQTDLAYYKFEPSQWEYEMEGADDDFDEICLLLQSELKRNELYKNSEWFLGFQSKLYQTCIEVLEKLKDEDYFKQISGRNIFLIFTVSDSELEVSEVRNIISRLNDNAYKEEYLNWMKTW